MSDLRAQARGSRKHVLDWTSRSEFVAELLQMVSPVQCRATALSRWMPVGYKAPAEARLETFGPKVVPNDEIWVELRRWWLAHEGGANTPNWDVAMGCEIEGKPGLVLVEAKANVPELSPHGKSIAPKPSRASDDNHQRISAAIADACDGLRQLDIYTAISRDTHYQLSNRVAFAWKLATLGVPTVLVYLGFIGDTGIADAGEPFLDDAHWRRVFASYASSIVPVGAFDRRIACGAAPMWLLRLSRPVLEISPARAPRSPR